jgi:hypothetical protein
MDDLPVPTRNASEDWHDDDMAWPTREVRRNRLHGALAVAAALLVGLALAWPGGPTRLIGEERLASLGGTFAALGDRLKVGQTSYVARDAAKPPPQSEPEPAERTATPARSTRAPATQANRPATSRTSARSTPAPQTADRSPEPAEPARRSTRPPAEEASTPTTREAPREPASEEPAVTARATGTAPRPQVVQVSLRVGHGDLHVGGRLEMPGSPELPLLDPVEITAAAIDAVSAVDAWARDPDDRRELAEVLADEAAREAQRVQDESRQQALDLLEADERGERYAEDAVLAEARLARKKARWERVQEQARSQAEGARDGERLTEPVDGWDERDDEDLLDTIFGRPPRVEPRD